MSTVQSESPEPGCLYSILTARACRRVTANGDAAVAQASFWRMLYPRISDSFYCSETISCETTLEDDGSS